MVLLSRVQVTVLQLMDMFLTPSCCQAIKPSKCNFNDLMWAMQMVMTTAVQVQIHGSDI